MERTLLLLYNPGADHLLRLKEIGPEWNIVHTTDKASAEKLIENAEVVMGNHHLSESIPFNNKTLRWIQTNSVGIDMILNKCSVPENIIMTNARGVYNDEISEHTMSLLLLLQRNLHTIRDAQQKHIWSRPVNLPVLRNKNVLIVGYGTLGKAIEEKLKIFGCNVFGVNTAIQFLNIHGENKHWKDHLPEIDILIMTLPLTAQTKKYIGEVELKKLPASAFVLNIGRAETLDEQALYKLLKDKQISKAALDVFAEEPLQKDSPVWDIQNLFVSPHMARTREVDPPYKFEKLFEDNFKHYVYGEQLLNMVDIKKGY